MRWAAGGIGRRVVATLGIAAGVVALAATPGSAKSSTSQQEKLVKDCKSFLESLAPVPKAEANAVSAAVIAPYAVLTRAQLPTDVPPTADGAAIGTALLGEVATYEPSLTRLVSTTASQSLYLVVGEHVAVQPTGKCRRVLSSAAVAAYRYEAELAPTGPLYCLVSVGASGGYDGSDCESLSQVDAGYDVGDITEPGQTRILAGLVPNAVGAVSLGYSGSATPIDGTVQSNVYAVPAPGFSPSSTPPKSTNTAVLRRFLLTQVPSQVQWLTAPGGTVTNTFTVPTALLNDAIDFLRAANEAQSKTKSTG